MGWLAASSSSAGKMNDYIEKIGFGAKIWNKMEITTTKDEMIEAKATKNGAKRQMTETGSGGSGARLRETRVDGVDRDRERKKKE